MMIVGCIDLRATPKQDVALYDIAGITGTIKDQEAEAQWELPPHQGQLR